MSGIDKRGAEDLPADVKGDLRREVTLEDRADEDVLESWDREKGES